MKKLLISLIVITFVVGCSNDEILTPETATTPQSLVMVEKVGLKLESTIVTDKVAINAKLPANGDYRIRIMDIVGKLVSQDKITAKEGDNVLSIYTSSLPKSSYTIELQDEYGKVLGSSIFVITE
jgi:hypothetical protein